MSDDTSAKDNRIKAIRTEVYSRVVGYYRPVRDWNRGKQEEFSEREYVRIDNIVDEQGS
jgi:anaerobic ribonucleoside-triphosphate reductase